MLNFTSTLPFNTAGHNSHPFGRRQREARGARVSVVLVVGFLGAGKTTLLNRLLDGTNPSHAPLIINEVSETYDGSDGEAGRDLPTGCVCCPSRGEIERVLGQLIRDHAAGRMTSLNRLIIETNGAADPSPILKSLLDERNLGQHFHLSSVVAVVDAATAGLTLVRSPEAQQQIAIADRIVITKADLVDDDRLSNVRALVASLNAAAPLALADHPSVDSDFLLRDGSLPWVRMDTPLLCTPVAEAHESFRLVFERPLPWDALSAALGILRDMRGTDLLRVKGLVAVDGCTGPIVIQIVQNVAQKPIELERWPASDYPSQLAFITRGITRAQVNALFDSIVSLRNDET